jgi:PhnB protein
MSSPELQGLIPYLGYADAPAAIDFLCAAFGFEEKMRHPMPDGRIGHAELVFQGHWLYVASAYPEFGLMSPRELPGVHAQIKCFVDDVDAHFERARAAGATIIAEPADQYGERMYRALDAEGNRWIFAVPLEQ